MLAVTERRSETADNFMSCEQGEPQDIARLLQRKLGVTGDYLRSLILPRAERGDIL